MDQKQIDLMSKLVPGFKDRPQTSEYWVKQAEKVIGTSTHDRGTYPAIDPFKGDGVFIYDVDGNEYLDTTAGVAVKAIGTRNKEFIEFQREIADMANEFSGQDFDYIAQTVLTERLLGITPNGDKKSAFYTTSGARTIEIAIKSAFDKTRRQRMVGFRPAFHGRTGWALTMTCSKATHREYFPTSFPVVRMPYAYCYRCPYHLTPGECKDKAFCAGAIRDALSMEGTDIAGILFEPISGEGGMVVPPASFAQGLREIADEFGAVLIADEVQAGMGRTGKWWAHENYDMAADTVCAAKALGGGYPMGVTIGDSPMFTGGGRNSETFSAEPKMALISLFILKYIEDHNLLANAKKVGDYMLGRLQEMVEKYECLGEARGIGLMMGVEFVTDKKSKKRNPETRNAVVNNCVNKQRLMVLGCGANAIRFIPPLIITMDQAKEAMDRFEKAVQEEM